MKATIISVCAASTMLSFASAAEPAQGEKTMTPALPPIVTLREQAVVRDQWLKDRLDTIVPALMRENGVDMWILVAREYMEDPVVATMLNATSLRARRRTILVFFDPGEGKPVERLTVSRYDLGEFFKSSWNPEEQADQWARLAELVKERNPQKIALNTSSVSAFGDGMTHSQYNDLVAAIGPDLSGRIVSGYPLAIGWLETRIPAEVEMYKRIVNTAHAIIGEGFSPEVIKPGVTTVDDLVWWYRQRIHDLGMQAWFQPGVAVYRKGIEKDLRGDTVIEKGDMIWNDFGIVYFNLNTDTQHLAYVLKDGESDAPKGLKAGLRAANAVQDAVTSSFRAGDTGNEILLRARAKALKEGLDPSIYSHPIGFHGHAAGSVIGYWDNQNPNPNGEYKVRPNTAWSIELKATVKVPEWDGQKVGFQSEEDAFFDGKTVTYIDGRQTKFHLIDTN